MKLAEAILDMLFPPRCPLCGEYVPRAGDWCDPCFTKAAAVRRLALDDASRSALDGVWSLGRYHEGFRQLLLSLKYESRRDGLPYFTSFLKRVSEKLPEELRRTDTAVPVPLHEAREKERGFNQTELIFRAWALSEGLSWQRAVLRTRSTTPQFGLDADARRKNLSGAFSLSDDADVYGRHVLLLDDICTTGTTLRMCAEALRRAGVASVTGLVLSSDRA